MMKLSTAAAVLNAQLIGEDTTFTSVNSDSRKVRAGELFVALKGEHFDGHNFAQQALNEGAAAALVSLASSANPAVIVPDTLKALGDLASYWRSQFAIPLAAITGSNGKTTVKEMLGSIAKAAVEDDAKVLATAGNLNNHIGMPMTLLKLNAAHEYAIIEMGMNHSGEISYLSNIAKPNVALINNAGNAHIGELGSFEAIANAKGEIFDGLTPDGIAVINQDDVFAPLWKSLVTNTLGEQKKIITFGLKNAADVTAKYSLHASASALTVTTPIGKFSVTLPAPGLHNVMNALAATATAIAMDISLKSIQQGLQNYGGVVGRLQHLNGFGGASVINDCYNANPSSMKAAIDVLMAKTGKKILVLGDMGELGEKAAEHHAEIGAYAQAAGVDALLTLGTLSMGMTETFNQNVAKNSTQTAAHYLTLQSLIADLRKHMNISSNVLVKGSRFMAMERIVNEIIIHDVTQNDKGAH